MSFFINWVDGMAIRLIFVHLMICVAAISGGGIAAAATGDRRRLPPVDFASLSHPGRVS